MDENELFKIRININGSILPLYLPRKDEEIYRKAEKTVKEVLKNYLSNYSQLCYEDVLASVALHIAVAYLRLVDDNDVTPLADKIKEFDIELNQLLEK